MAGEMTQRSTVALAVGLCPVPSDHMATHTVWDSRFRGSATLSGTMRQGIHMVHIHVYARKTLKHNH